MFKKLFSPHDWIITTSSVLLLVIGITTLYSTSISNSSTSGDYKKQIIFSIISIALYFTLSSIDYTVFRFKEILIPIYSILFVLLVLLKILNRSVRNTNRWISLVGGLEVQPSELAKIAVILLTAAVFSSNMVLRFKIIFSFLLSAPLFALVYIQPSLSATIILIVIWIAILFYSIPNQSKAFIFSIILIASSFVFSGIVSIPILGIGILLASVLFFIIIQRKNWQIILLALLLGAFIGLSGNHVVWPHIQSYQKSRITNFFNNNDPNSPGKFQTQQAKIAFGSGGIFGKGFAKGTQTRLNFLPEYQTDFIFASFGEEFGLIGTFLVFSLYLILLFRLIMNLDNTGDEFGYFITVGVITMLVFQITYNIGMNLGMVPVTGIPLPFFSYGGSSLLTVFICLGIIQGIYKTNNSKNLNKSYYLEDL